MPCIDWSDIEDAAHDMAGNHLRFECFAWHDRPDDSEDWCIVYSHNRDSGLIEQSNAAAIEAELQRYLEAEVPDVLPEHHGHWACGWIDGFAIRVYRDGQITEAFRTWCRLQEQLADYPLLDEEDYSRREYEAALDSIRQEGRGLVVDEAPDDWPAEVFSWLWENDQSELENTDDQGAYPSRESIRAALIELELLDATYRVVVGEWTVLETQSRSKAETEFDNLTWHASMGLGIAAAGAELTLLCDDELIGQYPEDCS